MKAPLLLVFLAGISLASSNSPYIVEVLFVVEPQVVGNYMDLGYNMHKAIENIENDFEFFLHEVNRFFQSIKDKVNIEVRSKELEFVFDDMFYDCKSTKNQQVDRDNVLDTFGKWISKNNVYERVGGFDMAVLYTGYDLMDDEDGTSLIGSGTIRTACNGAKSLATAEFDGIERTALTTAHVIAFSIGAENDPQTCVDDGYLMKKNLHVDNGHLRAFSDCSSTSILNFIRHLDETGNNCLEETLTLRHHFELTSLDGRDVMNVEKVCQRAKRTTTAYFCQYHNLYNGLHAKSQPFCHALYCATTGNTTCSSYIPTEGMICDEGKRCQDGKCLPAPRDFPVPYTARSECLYGDSKTISYKNNAATTCQAVVFQHRSACYNHKIEELCCATCRKVKQDVHDCEYGNKSPICDSYPKDFLCSEEANREMCCATCIDWTHIHSSYPSFGKRSLNETIIIEEEIFDDVIVEGQKSEPIARTYAAYYP